MSNTINAEKLAQYKAERKIINDAITAIITGAQSYSMGSRSVSKADLNTLLRERSRLDDLIAALDPGGRGRFRRVVPINR